MSLNFYTKTLANYATNVSFDDFPKEVVEKSKQHILDSIGCALGGYRTEVGQIITDFIKYLGGNPQSTVFGNKYRTACTYAAFANATLSNVLDYDDTIAVSTAGHPGSTVIPSAISVAEVTNASGKDLMTAVIVGYDVAVRVGKAVYPLPESGRKLFGMGTYQTMGGVAAAGKLLQLTKEEMISAFGIAGADAPIPSVLKTVSSTLGPSMIKNNFGRTAEAGVTGALLAKRGFRGPLDILDGDTGFWRAYEGNGPGKCDFDAMIHNLGKDYAIMEVGFKPYPVCRGIHSPIDGTLEIVKEHNIDPKDIKEIVVKCVPPFCEDKPPYNQREPTSMFDVQFSTPYPIALAIYGVEPGPNWYLEGSLKNPEIRKLAKKIVVVPYREVPEEMVSPLTYRISIVEIKTEGKRYVRRIEFPRGEPENPLKPQELENKFRVNASGVIEKENIKETINMIRNLEAIESVREITSLLQS